MIRKSMPSGYDPMGGNRFSEKIMLQQEGSAAKMDSRGWNFPGGPALSVRIEGTEVMLVERGLRVMNVEAVGDAYAIASNYLRQTGGIADTFVTNERLLEMIVGMFQRGEMNKIRLANKAISRFEAAALV
jgi:hypothetical protein